MTIRNLKEVEYFGFAFADRRSIYTALRFR